MEKLKKLTDLVTGCKLKNTLQKFNILKYYEFYFVVYSSPSLSKENTFQDTPVDAWNHEYYRTLYI